MPVISFRSFLFSITAGNDLGLKVKVQDEDHTLFPVLALESWFLTFLICYAQKYKICICFVNKLSLIFVL